MRYEYAVQNIDGSPEGQMMENMIVGFAAYYSRNLSKETKKASMKMPINACLMAVSLR